MWVEDLKPGETWAGAWRSLIACGDCRALFCVSPGALCPVCGWDYQERQAIFYHKLGNGEEIAIPSAFQGAIDWTTHVILGLMQQEWERPLNPTDRFDSLPSEKRPAQRLAIVLLFWSLFEHLMERFFDAATQDLPVGVKSDLLKRYSSIGSRLDRLFRILFAVTFKDDLIHLGYSDISTHLDLVRDRRNRFIHGDPESIDSTLVYDTVKLLPQVHEAWISLYNARCSRPKT